jgi:hypothetical protein
VARARASLSAGTRRRRVGRSSSRPRMGRRGPSMAFFTATAWRPSSWRMQLFQWLAARRAARKPASTPKPSSTYMS